MGWDPYNPSENTGNREEPSQTLSGSRQARLPWAEGLSCLNPQQPQPPARGSLEADLERLPSLSACSTHLTSETLVGDGWWVKQRSGPGTAPHTTLDPGSQHSPGLDGQGAHKVTPQKAPTLPQQSSWVVSSSRGLAHWKKGHGMCHLFPPLLCREMSQGSLRQVLSTPIPCQRTPHPREARKESTGVPEGS